MTFDNAELKEALTKAQTALVEKLGEQPYIGLRLSLDGNNWICGGAYMEMNMIERLDGKPCDAPDDAIRSAMDAIAKLPSKADRGLREFHKKVAEAIDLGRDVGVDLQFINPLIEMSRKLAENAIEHEGAQK